MMCQFKCCECTTDVSAKHPWLNKQQVLKTGDQQQPTKWCSPKLNDERLSLIRFTRHFPDFCPTFDQVPEFSMTAVKFPVISRFSRQALHVITQHYLHGPVQSWAILVNTQARQSISKTQQLGSAASWRRQNGAKSQNITRGKSLTGSHAGFSLSWLSTGRLSLLIHQTLLSRHLRLFLGYNQPHADTPAHNQAADWLIDWLSCGFTSYSTQTRFFGIIVSWLGMEKN